MENQGSDCKSPRAEDHLVWWYNAWHNKAGISMGRRRHYYNVNINILFTCLISSVISQLFRVIWSFVSFARLK